MHCYAIFRWGMITTSFQMAMSCLDDFLCSLMIFPSRYFSHYNKGGDDYLRLDDDDYTGICGCFSRYYDDRTLQQIIMMTMMIMIMMKMMIMMTMMNMMMMTPIPDVNTQPASTVTTAVVMTLFSEMADGAYIIITVIVTLTLCVPTQFIIYSWASPLPKVPLHPWTSAT